MAQKPQHHEQHEHHEQKHEAPAKPSGPILPGANEPGEVPPSDLGTSRDPHRKDKE